MAEESAIIVWDEATKTEHFIRRATFQSDAAEWGFLVPTPGVPVMAEAEDAAFTRLEERIEPEVREVRHRGVYLTSIFAAGMSRDGAPASRAAGGVDSVRVLSQQRVGDYEAVVLEADDSGALAKWLRVRRYANDPSLRDWLAPYVERRWKVTAFKMVAGAGEKAVPVRSRAVRMSFKTDVPVFPYREPLVKRRARDPYASERLLRVFLLGTERMDGHLGRTRVAGWPGAVKWTNAVPGIDRRKFAEEIGMRPDELPGSLWLTAFEDPSGTRPGADDLFFSPAEDQSPILPPPIVREVDARVPLPFEIVVLFGVGAVWIVSRIRRGGAIDHETLPPRRGQSDADR